MPWPKNILVDLSVNRVDLVDEGADDEAYIKLFKSKGGNLIMTLEEVIAKLKKEHQEVITTAINKAKEEIPEKVAKELTQLREEVKKNKGTKNPEEKNEEEILKNLDPAIKSIVEKARLQAKAASDMVKKMKEDQEEKEAIAKAKELPNIGVEENTLVEIYKSLSKLSGDACDKYFSVLKKVNDALAKSTLFTEIGKGRDTSETSGDSNTAWQAIEKEAQQIMKAKNISKEAAISETITSKPELYNKYLNALE